MTVRYLSKPVVYNPFEVEKDTSRGQFIPPATGWVTVTPEVPKFLHYI